METCQIQTFSYEYAASVPDDTAVNPNGIKTLLANILSTFLIKDNPFFSNSPENLPKNPPDCSILCNWVFVNFILGDEPFARAIWSFEACVLDLSNVVGDYNHEKLFSWLQSPATFDKTFKVTSVLTFISYFNLLSCELDNFTFKCYIESFHIKAKNKVRILLKFLAKNVKLFL